MSEAKSQIKVIKKAKMPKVLALKTLRADAAKKPKALTAEDKIQKVESKTTKKPKALTAEAKTNIQKVETKTPKKPNEQDVLKAKKKKPKQDAQPVKVEKVEKVQAEQVEPEKVKPKSEKIDAVIYLQDNLLKVADCIDLQRSGFVQTFDETTVEYSDKIVEALVKAGVRFTVCSVENPNQQFLEFESFGIYVPKGQEEILHVKFLTEKGKVRYNNLTYSQLLLEMSKGCAISQIHGNLTHQQAETLKVKVKAKTGKFKIFN